MILGIASSMVEEGLGRYTRMDRGAVSCGRFDEWLSLRLAFRGIISVLRALEKYQRVPQVLDSLMGLDLLRTETVGLEGQQLWCRRLFRSGKGLIGGYIDGS
jgi:hypothetical protein